MRRTPAVALVGLLLGLSGCAGVPQRLGWSSPATDRSDPADTSAPGRLSWWPWPRTEQSTPDQATKIAETRETTQPELTTKLPTDVWPESRSEWLARRFPLLNRALNGPTVSAAVDSDARVRELNGRLLAPWSTMAGGTRRGRDDNDVRPVDATATNEDASGDRQTVPGRRSERMPPLLATPLVVKVPPHSLPETSGDVALDINHAERSQASQVQSDEAEMPSAETGPASTSTVDSASVSSTSSGVRPTSELPASSQPNASMGSAQPEPASSSPDDSASVVAMSAIDRSSSEPPANNAADATLEPVTAPSSEPGLETPPTQDPAAPGPNTQPPSSIPPPPPPVRQTPPPAPPNVPDRPATNPAQPDTSTPPAPEVAKPKGAEETPPQPPPAPSTPETPQVPVAPAPTTVAPAATSAAPPAPRFGQPFVSGAYRGLYASPPPMAPPRPRHKFLGLFFVEDTPQPLATPQLPPAMFPASYRVQTPPPPPVFAASQAVAATPPPVACDVSPKPCVLSVLFQKIKSCGKRSGFSGCHHGGSAPCCQGCTCYTGTNKPAQVSPQGSLTSPQGKSAYCQGHPVSQSAQLGSNGTKPGNVAEEGKLFERVSFESFDEATQR